ncbi:FAD-dependent 5-carboxymethylaminomethyl-2-thiouridine(34) oxidoreductase MnmC [Salinimonas marina]|uniref:FAD-dependent 5-carboxymethylaminomethyl-2-thiouridine(34) oxidoreductase MnmC n=1 Tax=Salinimonas marina TaxID=2785918 RepID=UPI001E5C2B23|nr:FAD-dependent 5-carboxymethylaminomethyl-2-thiouridine(34) oxidoreductase MnmC [Salinimonas marina]
MHDLLPQWHAPGETPEQGLVDAWFLDGFAPSKNPQMWTEALFGQMARLSKPGTTFATFTAAGIVKRGLAAQGFAVTKCRGFGRKRDMLTGTWKPAEASTEGERGPRAGVSDAPYYRYTTEPLTAADNVAVVGAGLAGAMTALALVRRGIRVSLITQAQQPADGASGNPQGGFYPQLHTVRSPASELQAHSFIYARRYYDWLLDQGGSFAHQWCGVLLLDFNDKVAARHQLMQEEQTWPQELIDGVDAHRASNLAGVSLPYPALFCPMGGWISPPQLVESLIEQAQQTGLLSFQPNTQVTGFRTHPDHVTLTTGNTETDFSHVVFASGESPALSLEQYLPLRPVRGQVEAVKSVAPLNQLQTVLCHKGYLTPALNGYHAMGSTYVKNDTATETRQQESQQNEQLHQRVLGMTSWGTAYVPAARPGLRPGRHCLIISPRQAICLLLQPPVSHGWRWAKALGWPEYPRRRPSGCRYSPAWVPEV